MSKPSWKDAPEWAIYRAQDRSGHWYWYELKPKPSKELSIWVSKDDCVILASIGLPNENWMDTLEERPQFFEKDNTFRHNIKSRLKHKLSFHRRRNSTCAAIK